MNILFILNSFFPSIGGVEKVIENYCRQLLEIGANKISIITFKRGQISELDLKKTKNLEIHHGIRIYRVKDNLFGLFMFIKMIKLYFKEKFDLIHTTDFWGIYSILFKLMFKVPIVHHIHGYQEICPNGLLLHGENCLHTSLRECQRRCDFRFHRYMIEKIIYKVLGRFSDIVLTVSDAVKQAYLEKHPQLKNRMFTLYNGVEINPIYENKRDNRFFLTDMINANDKILTFVGRLIPERNIYEIISNFPKIIDKDPNIKFIIVGSGPELKRLKKQVMDLQLEQHIKFTGLLIGRSLFEIYRNSDLLLMPIIFPEPLSTVIIESMSQGCPVITYNLGGMPEIIDDGKNGFLLEPYNWEGFLEIITGPFDKISRNKIIEKIKKKFNIEKQARKLLAIYKIVLNRY
ncbi:MAG: glycosyltransferase [Candidatus Lokiarchaeota archaeon]|nr:glycosyltransferase [Candidatus Lokiarchaeota archaeon]